MALIDIVPGQTGEFSCPEGSTPRVKEGDLIPATAPLFYVLKVDGTRVTLGPLKAGRLNASLNCGTETPVSIEAQVTPLKKENLPQAGGVLLPFEFSYPSWMWLVLGLLIALVFAGVFTFLHKTCSKPVSRARTPALPKLPADQALAAFLKTSGGHARYFEGLDPGAVKSFYAQTNDLLRSFLELKLGFSAKAATTQEFIGEYKAKLVAHPEGNQLMTQIESILRQADLVRFSGESPTPETLKNVHKELQSLSEKLR